MAQDDCAASLQACYLRAALLGPDGVPLVGASSAYVTNAFVKVMLKPVMEAGQEYQTKNGCGEFCTNYRGYDVMSRVDVEVELCSPDPELHQLLAGGSLITSGGKTIGYQFPALRQAANPNGVSLEVWTKAIVGDTQAPVNPWWKWVIPRVYLSLSDRNLENASMTNPLVGYATENPNWFNGPFGDWSYDSTRIVQYARVSSGSLPLVKCGVQAVAAS